MSDGGPSGQSHRTSTGQTGQGNPSFSTRGVPSRQGNRYPGKRGAGAAAKEELTYQLINAAHTETTEAQWDEIAELLKGKPVAWSGVVIDVDRNLLDDLYEVWIDMDNTGVQDVTFDVTRSVAIGLRKGRRYRFTGRIERATSTLGLLIIRLAGAKITTP